MTLGKTIRRMQFYQDEEGSSFVFCYANDVETQNGIIRGFETAKFTEIFRLKIKGLLTAFHLIVEGPKKFLLLASKSLETLKVKLQIIAVNSKVISSPQLFYSGSFGSGGNANSSFENSSYLSSSYAESEGFFSDISCIKSFYLDSCMILIIAEGKHLHAIQFPEKNPKSFLNEDIAIFTCRNFISCVEIDQSQGILFIADSRDGIFALRLNVEEQKFDLLACWTKIRLASDILFLDGFIYCLDKMGNISILSFNGGEFQEQGKCNIEDIPIRMTSLKTFPTHSSLQDESISSTKQVVFGTVAGNLWSISQVNPPESFYQSAYSSDIVINRELLDGENDFWTNILGWNCF